MNKIDICNMALSFLGSTQPLTSFADNTTESRLCDRFYEIARKVMLVEYPWSFAKKSYIELVPVEDTTHPQYAYIYLYPEDALRLLAIVNGTEGSGIVNSYEVISAVDESNNMIRQIVCDVPEAKVDYIFDQVEVDLFSALFCEALAWKLASLIGIGLSKDAKVAQYAGQMQMIASENARRMEALQQYKPINQGNRYITSRR